VAAMSGKRPRVNKSRRRCKAELTRPFRCTESACERRYQAFRSLQHHLWVAHNIKRTRAEYTQLFGEFYEENEARDAAQAPKDDVANFGAYFLNPVVVRDAEAVGIYAALGVGGAALEGLKFGRSDIINVISLISPDRAISAIGDVLRVDMGVDSGFPNGRAIPGGARPDQEQADVTDVVLSLVLSGLTLPIADGVDYNDKPFLTEFPFLPLPHQGFAGGHGKPTP
jgi:hypothetical protein